jgi:hypothetical protein
MDARVSTTPLRAHRQAKRELPPRHKLSPLRGFMFRRMKELRLLAAFRTDHGVALGEDRAWAFLTAEICLYRYDGHDLEVFERIAPFDIPTKVAKAALHRVCRIAARRGGMFKPTSGVAAGRNLDLTAEERLFCDIRTMRAVDETPAEAKARRQEEDRERKRRERRKADKAKERQRGRRRRAAKGARPHAESLSRKQPWLLKGMSRATYYRHRETGPSTPSRETNSSVRHILTSFCRLRTDVSVSPSKPNGHLHHLGPSPSLGGVEPCQRHQRGADAKRKAAEQTVPSFATFNADDVVWIPLSTGNAMEAMRH